MSEGKTDLESLLLAQTTMMTEMMSTIKLLSEKVESLESKLTRNEDPIQRHILRLRDGLYRAGMFTRYPKLPDGLRFGHIVEYLNVVELCRLDTALTSHRVNDNGEERASFLSLISLRPLPGVTKGIIPSFEALEWMYKRNLLQARIRNIKFVDVNSKDDGILHLYVHNMYQKQRVEFDFVKKVLQCVNLDERRRHDGCTSLIWAAIKGYTDLAKELIAQGADINASCTIGNTALINGAYNNRIEICNALIEAGANLDACNNGGASALIWACEQGYEEIANTLISHGCNLDLCTKEKKNTALTCAAKAGRTEMVEALVNAGADIHKRNSAGDTALDLAMRYNYEDILAILTASD